MAQQQILQPLGTFPNEQILAFIGVHAKTAITGKRDSVGFLITNLRVLTQTDYSVIGKAKTAQIDLFTKTQLPDKLISKIWNDFTIKNTLQIKQEQLLSLNSALKSVIEIILPQLQTGDHLPSEVKKSANIFERIKDLGLQNDLKIYSENEKKYKIFSEKYKVSEIICGSVDKPLFGGVYGFVFTKDGITSRDLMEDAVSCTWEEIKKFPAQVASKKEEFLAGQKKHIVPSYQSSIIPSLITLINEVANGEIVI
ncbi:hypothetical protein PG637_02475 [Riemerella anatipestifer]|nr:hypothetical protein [Riemerella anatipestifer]MDY3324537.1 hypothetical protein [Riemerella anatipestifer]MDY3353347.1 hypothetical protein [Riemerella anatipestifer]